MYIAVVISARLVIWSSESHKYCQAQSDGNNAEQNGHRIFVGQVDTVLKRSGLGVVIEGVSRKILEDTNFLGITRECGKDI